MKNKNKGFAMVLALVIISALLITATSIMSFAFFSQKVTLEAGNKKKIKYIAESGIELAIAKLKNVDGVVTGVLDVPFVSTQATYATIPTDPDVNVKCDIYLNKSGADYVITSIATQNSKTFTITATVDGNSSFKGNDYVGDIASKTISAIPTKDMIVPPTSFTLKSTLDIIGSFYVEGNNVSLSGGTMTVNNTDKNHSGDSKIKLYNSEIPYDDINNQIAKTETNWLGQYNKPTGGYPSKITTKVLKQKQLLPIDSSVTQLTPEFIVSATDNPMVIWKVPKTDPTNVKWITSTSNPDKKVFDFANTNIKNYIINSLPDEHYFKDYIDVASNPYDSYNAKGETTDEAKANDDIVEEKYRNLYKVILVDGDLLWNHPSKYYQAINWVVYCTGKITFTSDYYPTSDPPPDPDPGPHEYLNDNVNCSFLANEFVFDNAIDADLPTYPDVDDLNNPDVNRNNTGNTFRTNISFCNMKDTQKDNLYNFLKHNLVNYYDGLDVVIKNWTEAYVG